MEYRAFILTMPDNNSWNGKWPGEERFYCIVKRYKKNSPVLENVDKDRSHYYNFGDGWGALVTIKNISADEARAYRKRSVGFSGYDWMIDEIEKYGDILTRKERESKKATA